jgi:sarcosine oxidase gamma subunit
VAELRSVSPTVIAILASAATLDGLRAPKDTTVCRVAPREALVIGGDGLTAAAIEVKERGVVVDDVTDGWSAFELAGEDAHEAFARLSELELPDEGFTQGDVARIGAKILTASGRITILVPASLAVFIEERIRTDCAEVLA